MLKGRGPMSNKFPLLYCTGLVPLKTHYHNKQVVVEAGKVISQEIIDAHHKLAAEFIISVRHSPNNDEIVERNRRNHEKSQQSHALENMTHYYEAETLIFAQDDTSTELYVLLEGEVEVIIDEEVVATLSESGTYFGEMAVLRGEPRSAGVRTKSPCTFYVIPGTTFPQVLKANPEMSLKMSEILSQRLAHTTLDMRHLQDDIKNCKEQIEKLNHEKSDLQAKAEELDFKLTHFKPMIAESEAAVTKYKDAAMTLYRHSSIEYNGALRLIKTLAQHCHDKESRENFAAVFDYMKKASNMPSKGRRGPIKEECLNPTLKKLI